jgi:hypothetical protein
VADLSIQLTDEGLRLSEVQTSVRRPGVIYRASVAITTAQATYTTSPTTTPAPNSLLMAFVVSCYASAPTEPTGVTGHGQTYTKVTLPSNALSTTHLISLWIANAGGAPTSAAVVASQGGTTTGGAVIECEITDVDFETLLSSLAYLQTATGTGTTGTVAVPLAAHNVNDDVLISFWVHLANEATNPRTNWTETSGADGNFNSPATGVEMQFRTDVYENTASATWTTSAAWIGLVVGIDAASGVDPSEALKISDQVTAERYGDRNVPAENLELDDIGQGTTQLIGPGSWLHISDSVTAALVAGSTDLSRQITPDDALKISESVQATENPLQITQTSTVKVSDSLQASLDLIASPTESLKVSHSVIAAIDLVASLTDTAKIGEVLQVLREPLEAVVLDSLKISESAQAIRGGDLAQAVSDESLKVSDSATATLQAGDLSVTIATEQIKISETLLPSRTTQASAVLTATNAAWPWPPGVTALTAEAIGGGGAGGAGTGNPADGGGGKGGSYARVVITKGGESTLNVTVGAGGLIVTNSSGGAGGASTIVQVASTVLSAAGGGGGAVASVNSTNGAGGTTLNGSNTGTITFAGGNGGTGNFTSGVQGSGAGGGSAGPASVGGAASVNVGGTAGTGTFLDGSTRQVAGANGVGNNLPGIAGSNYGGGGSGGKTIATANQQGANGGPGVVVLTWDIPTLTITIPSESLKISDDATGQLVSEPTVVVTSENVKLSDSGIAAQLISNDLTSSQSESSAIDDLGQGFTQMVGVVHVVDQLTAVIGETGLETVFVTDSLKIADSLTVLREPLGAALIESLKIDDATNNWAQIYEPETIKISEVVSVVIGDMVVAIGQESLKISDSITASVFGSLVVPAESIRIDDLGEGVTKLFGVIHVVDQITAVMGAEGAITASATENLKISDSITALREPLEVGQTSTIKISDSVTASVGDIGVAVSQEALKISEFFQGSEDPLNTSATESLKISDAVTALSGMGASVAENLKIYDSVTAFLDAVVSLAENLKISESVQVAREPFEASKTENVKISDSITAVVGDIGTATQESLKVSESLQLTIDPLQLNQTSTVKISDSVQAAITLEAAAADGLKISDSVTTSLGLIATLQEDIKVGDSVQAVRYPLEVNQTETVKVSDQLNASSTNDLFVSTVQESLKVADVVNIVENPLETARSESPKVSDSVLVLLPTLVALVEENVKINDVVSVQTTVLQVILTETLRLSDEVVRSSGGDVTVGDYVVTDVTVGDYPVTEVTVGDFLLVVAP